MTALSRFGLVGFFVGAEAQVRKRVVLVASFLLGLFLTMGIARDLSEDVAVLVVLGTSLALTVPLSFLYSRIAGRAKFYWNRVLAESRYQRRLSQLAQRRRELGDDVRTAVFARHSEHAVSSVRYGPMTEDSVSSVLYDQIRNAQASSVLRDSHSSGRWTGVLADETLKEIIREIVREELVRQRRLPAASLPETPNPKKSVAKAKRAMPEVPRAEGPRKQGKSSRRKGKRNG